MKYNINNNNLSKVLFNIEKEIKQNSKIIKELLEIDYKYCKTNVNIDKLINILNSLKNEEIDIQKEQKICIKYNGDPCITLNLSILAILTKSTIILDCNEYMIGINTIIVEIVNAILSDFKTDKLVLLKDSPQKEFENIEEIICIDNINQYNEYLRKNIKAKFYSFNYLDFYSDSDEFEEIEDLIYEYAEKNQIQIENYSELDSNEAIEMMANGIGQAIVILTKDKKTQENFEQSIKNKKIYINKNPFEGNVKLINKEILLK